MRADFKKPEIAHAIGGVPSGRCDKVDQQRRPQGVEIGGDPVDQNRVARRAAAKGAAPKRSHERPGHRLHQPVSGERVAENRERGAAAGSMAGRATTGLSGSGHRRNGVVANDPGDLLDEIRLAFDIGAPARHGNATLKSLVPALALASDLEAEGIEDRDLTRGRDLEAPRRPTSLGAKLRRRTAAGAAPATTTSLGVPPQSSRIRRVAISMPGWTKAGSRPRSKR